MSRKPSRAVTAAVEDVLAERCTVREAAERHGCSTEGIRARIRRNGLAVGHELKPKGSPLALLPPPEAVADAAPDYAALPLVEQLGGQVRKLAEATDAALNAGALTSYAKLTHQLRQATMALHEERLRLRALEPEPLAEVDADALVEEVVRGLRKLPRGIVDAIAIGLAEARATA